MHPGSTAGPLTWFHTTPWTLIDRLGPASGQRDGALDRLVRVYWGAVYSYLRRRGHTADEAAELTEGFFVHVVLSRALFERADRTRGRLRSLMLTALRHYVADVQRREGRRPDARHADVNLAAEERLAAQSEGADPAAAFDRRWALAAVAEAALRCEAHFHARGKPGHWGVFEARVMGPAVRAAMPPPLEAAAAANGFGNPADAAAAVQTVKKRFEALLHEVVAETVADEADAAGEFDELMRLLA